MSYEKNLRLINDVRAEFWGRVHDRLPDNPTQEDLQRAIRDVGAEQRRKFRWQMGRWVAGMAVGLGGLVLVLELAERGVL